SFEIDASRPHGSGSLGSLETILSRAEHVSALAASLSSDSSWQEWRSCHLMRNTPRVSYETSLRGESSARPMAIAQRTPTLISRAPWLVGPKRSNGYRSKAVELQSSPRLRRKLNRSAVRLSVRCFHKAMNRSALNRRRGA